MELMAWQECEEKFIRNVSIDPSKIKSIITMAQSRLEFAKSIKVEENNVSFVFENYYEVIKELLIAVLLQKGLRSKNHQCLITYFAKEYDYQAEVQLIKQMSFLRNRLNYYGEAIEYEYFIAKKEQFEKIIELIKGVLNIEI
jgi:uncharacterized protein (UPF0332 family)